MLRLPCFRVIAPRCIVPSCGPIIQKSTFAKIRVAFNNAYRKSFGELSKRSSASAMYANHNICSFETMLRKNVIIWSHAKTRK